MTINEYIAELRKELAHGDATEHTHRPALKSLLQSLGDHITATNEPKRIECGAPDFNIRHGKVPIGYVETKDIGANLDEMERGKGPHGEQFKRYVTGLPNWVLTDYLEFRWYVDGQKRLTARLATPGKRGKLTLLPDGEQEVTSLLQAFYKEEAFTIGTAKELAQHLAGMTRIVRDLIVRTFAHEKEKGWLHTWLSAFREVLIPDLTEKQFADMFAQTLAYGMFAARIHTYPEKDFSREKAAFSLPKTNPFLRKLFSEIAGVDMPDTINWAVDDIVELLKHASIGDILKDFGKATGKEDPIVHFYETFLNAYDPKMRELRGVYYTPEPVVSYIVRSLDHLLKTRFNRVKGFADQNTLVLDPAVGTATFLYFTIQQIYKHFAKQKGAWDEYVSEHLLNRVFGFELLMAPYAVAHLKLGMELQETGYGFGSHQRLGIYLTNTLEEAAKKSEKLFAGWISDEANAAAEIKRDRPILVVLGNPPYSGHSANRNRDADGKLTFIGKLMEDYKEGCPELHKPAQAKWLQDDYVKFIRFAQWRIDRTGEGLIGYITNHSYLDNPTFRGMRRKLLDTFDELFIYDLHGNSKKKEHAPDGRKDENVFDIQQGVAILLCVKRDGNSTAATVYHADLWGLRDFKYETLLEHDVSSTKWKKLKPEAPSYLFVPSNAELQQEYEQGLSIPSIFNQNGDPAPGIVTTHDEFAISWSKQEAIGKVESLLETRNETEALGLFRLCRTTQWNYARAKDELEDDKWRKQAGLILYRPFDKRWTVYNPNVAVHRRMRASEHFLLGCNIGLCVGKAGQVVGGTEWNLVTITNTPVDFNLFYRGGACNFPLYLYPDPKQKSFHEVKQVNISPQLIKYLEKHLELEWIEDGCGDLTSTLGPQDVLNYVYAILHSPAYRSRYADFLKRDFPRVPFTTERKLFRSLSKKGSQLISLHLLEAPEVEELVTEFPEKGTNIVDRVDYLDTKERVWINSEQFFDGVSPEVWEYHIGGYPACHKWLKDRKGRKLSYDEVQHWQRIVVAIKESIRLAGEIDAAIPGWPLP
ncbi:MAG: type ISP restriction/modification enzyme [Terriglobales bacterium]